MKVNNILLYRVICYSIWYRLPENGETVEADGYRFEVVTMEYHKIEKVHIVSIEQDESKD